LKHKLNDNIEYLTEKKHNMKEKHHIAFSKIRTKKLLSPSAECVFIMGTKTRKSMNFQPLIISHTPFTAFKEI